MLQPNKWVDVPLSDFFESTSNVHTGRTYIRQNGKQIWGCVYGINGNLYNRGEWFTVKSAYAPNRVYTTAVMGNDAKDYGVLWLNGESKAAFLSDDIPQPMSPIITLNYLLP